MKIRIFEKKTDMEYWPLITLSFTTITGLIGIYIKLKLDISNNHAKIEEIKNSYMIRHDENRKDIKRNYEEHSHDISRIEKNFQQHELLNERTFDKFERKMDADFKAVFNEFSEIRKTLMEINGKMPRITERDT